MADGRSGPRRVAVVGAGMVGLSTAWFLQDQGVEVTILDRTGVAAGATFGNAGWLTPSLATPLPEPAVLAYGVRAMLRPTSPVYVPATADLRLLVFLTRFARNSTAARWRRAMAALVPMNGKALSAYDALLAGGVGVVAPQETALLAAYRTAAERQALVDEITHIRAAGQPLDFDLLDGDEARAAEPALSRQIGAAVRIAGQRYVDPARFAEAVAQSVQQRGGVIRAGADVTSVRGAGAGVIVQQAGPGQGEVFDAVVVATGAWLGELAREAGVRRAVQAGRGYSFSCAAAPLPKGPLYFPVQRVACTPLRGRLRLAGMMEFRPAGAPLDVRRVDAIVRAAAPLLKNVDLRVREDEWVGARPVTADGLPLIGATRTRGVYVAGGHGMWGVTLGPATGQLLAELITTGRTPRELAPFDPLR